jgi:hypothetical protein
MTQSQEMARDAAAVQTADTTHNVDTKERAMSREEQELGFQPHPSKIVRFYSHPWTQILLISFICFCLPGVSHSNSNSSTCPGWCE